MAYVNEWKIRQQMCDIGRRIWLKGFCAGNEGNHSFRLSASRILCTPTGISKGDLTLLVAFGAGLTYGSALIRW